MAQRVQKMSAEVASQRNQRQRQILVSGVNGVIGHLGMTGKDAMNKY